MIASKWRTIKGINSTCLAEYLALLLFVVINLIFPLPSRIDYGYE